MVLKRKFQKSFKSITKVLPGIFQMYQKNFEGVLGKIYVQIPGYLDRSMRVLNYNGEKHGDQCFPSFPLSPHSIVLFNLL